MIGVRLNVSHSLVSLSMRPGIKALRFEVVRPNEGPLSENCSRVSQSVTTLSALNLGVSEFLWQ